MHLLSLEVVAPGAPRLSLLLPAYCLVSLQAWPAKRQGGAAPHEKEKQVAIPLRSSSGLCSLSSWNDCCMVMRERECVRVSQADSADREGLSKWAIFMFLITKATVEPPPRSTLCGSVHLRGCVLTAPASTCRFQHCLADSL